MLFQTLKQTVRGEGFGSTGINFHDNFNRLQTEVYI